MLVKQISVFLENKSGRLAEITQLLGENNINISALSIADTADFGILRIIVNDPDNAINILKKNNYTVSETDVIAIAIPDKPGGLLIALSALEEAKIDIEYMYAFVGRKENQALVILRVEDNNKAIDRLSKKNINVIHSQDIYDMWS